jgi:hypothetical protein
MPTKIAPARTWGQKRARSAIPPEIMAGMQAAKQRRKKKRTSSNPLLSPSSPAAGWKKLMP